MNDRNDRTPLGGGETRLRWARIAPGFPLWAQCALGLALIALPMIFLDEALYMYARSLDRAVIRAANVLTRIGDAKWVLVGLAVLLAGAVLIRPRNPDGARAATVNRLIRGCLFVFASVAFTGILVNILKPVFGRARPKLFDQLGPHAFDPLSFGYDFASFPSGHSTTIFALAVALAFLLPRAKAPLLLVAAFFACTRIVLGAHYLSDVIAGAFMSALAVAWLRHWFAGRGVLFAAAGDGRIGLRENAVRIPLAGRRETANEGDES